MTTFWETVIRHTREGGYPERIEHTGFTFSRLRAEALWRASTGMTTFYDSIEVEISPKTKKAMDPFHSLFEI